MIDFWMPAGLMLLVALAFLLIPALRVRKQQAEEDRTALNVALYQERIAELEQQNAAGALTAQQLENGRAEAARELLDDTEADKQRRGVLGNKIPVLAAILVPVLALGLYMHWGAYDELEQAREMANMQPQSLDQMTATLEQAVKDTPQSAEAWYFLGRTYMSQGRANEASHAFSKAVEHAGRVPELLGQWAQALYFANGKVWRDELQALTDEALAQDANEMTSLGLLGIAAYEAGRYADAVNYWQRLVAVLPAEDPSREAILGGIERARQQMGEESSAEPAVVAAALLEVSVDVAPQIKAELEPTDSVFVFARALNGPPMPLAVKRLSVADLPAKVSLSDSDAMMADLKLSGFDQVLLVARISRAGNAISGEWVGQSEPVSTDDDQVQLLLIDQADVKAP